MLVNGVEIKTPVDVRNASDETLFYMDRAMTAAKSDLKLSSETIDAFCEEWTIRGIGILRGIPFGGGTNPCV